MADLLSKVKIGNVVYDLKDANARTNISTLVGSHELKALGEAAWRAVAAQMSDGEGKIATAATVKNYVDTQIGAIKTFDVVVCEAVAAKIPAGAEYRDGTTVITGTMAASADTMKKLYMVKNNNAGSGAYLEWISIDKGESASPRYVWECIGSTAIDLKDYVKKETLIAGVEIGDGIEVQQLQNALNLGDMAYKNLANLYGNYAGETIKNVKATYTPAGNVALNDFTQTSTAATLTRADYTPAGSVDVTAADNGAVLTGGSINVTVKDAAAGTAVTDITYDSYTPAGTINKPAVNLTSVSKDVVVGLTGGSVASKARDTFTPNTPTSIDTTKFSGGSFTGATQASFTQGTHASFTQGTHASLSTSNISYVEEGVKIAIDDEDAEMLVFTDVTAKSAKAVDTFTPDGNDTFVPDGDDSFTANNVGTFTAASLNEGFYTKGTAALFEEGDFTPNVLQSASKESINNVSAAELAAAPEFTGTADNIKFKGAKYLKQEINEKTFTPTKGDLSFTGTKVAQFQVTGVNYDKATANGATFTGTAGEAAVGDIVVSSSRIEIEDEA